MHSVNMQAQCEQVRKDLPRTFGASMKEFKLLYTHDELHRRGFFDPATDITVRAPQPRAVWITLHS